MDVALTNDVCRLSTTYNITATVYVYAMLESLARVVKYVHVALK